MFCQKNFWAVFDVIVETALFNPFSEVFDSHEGELKVPLSGGQGPDDVQAPALERPCMGDQLCILRGAA